MPIKFTQAVLQTDDETRRWMRTVYGFLAARPDSAFHRDELLAVWPELADAGERDRFLEALVALTGLGALEAKEIQGLMFYIFRRELDSVA